VSGASGRRRPRRAVRWRGRGLFSGKAVQLTVAPSEPGSGWQWAVGQGPATPLLATQLEPQPQHSSLRDAKGGALAKLPEHILAALVMLDIDDCTIRFHQGEAPVLDGSALPFTRGLLQAGICGDPATRELLVEVTWQGRQVCWNGGTEPARARTFIDVEHARDLGGTDYFPGATPHCALVFGRQGASRYGGGPRLRSEPAWHKLLDVLGDLGPYRAPGRLNGVLRLSDPSHLTNPTAIEEALADARLAYDEEVSTDSG